jgi:lipopolysaccharide export system protein LptA
MTRFILVLAMLIASPAFAQQIAFGGLKQDTTLPVDIGADSLTVNNADGTATFTGNVLVGQGDMRLKAGEIQVVYGTDGKSIQSLMATGGVTLTTGGEAAEAQRADYTIASGEVVMSGDVLLTGWKAACKPRSCPARTDARFDSDPRRCRPACAVIAEKL